MGIFVIAILLILPQSPNFKGLSLPRECSTHCEGCTQGRPLFTKFLARVAVNISISYNWNSFLKEKGRVPLPPFYYVVRLLHSYKKILILLGFTFKSTCLWTILNVLPMKAGLSPIIWRLQIKFPKTQTGISDKHYLSIAKASEIPPKGQLSKLYTSGIHRG